VVEEDAVVLVRQAFHVFFEQKLHNVELGAVQPKKVLDSHGDPVWSHASLESDSLMSSPSSTATTDPPLGPTSVAAASSR